MELAWLQIEEIISYAKAVIIKQKKNNAFKEGLNVKKEEEKIGRKKSLAQEVRQKSDISDRRSKGWR